MATIWLRLGRADFMLINHAHHLAADAKALVESNTFVKGDCCDVDSLSVTVPMGNGWSVSGEKKKL